MAEKINNTTLKNGQIVQEDDGSITFNLVLENGVGLRVAQEQVQHGPGLTKFRPTVPYGNGERGQ